MPLRIDSCIFCSPENPFYRILPVGAFDSYIDSSLPTACMQHAKFRLHASNPAWSTSTLLIVPSDGDFSHSNKKEDGDMCLTIIETTWGLYTEAPLFMHEENWSSSACRSRSSLEAIHLEGDVANLRTLSLMLSALWIYTCPYNLNPLGILRLRAGTSN